MRNSHNAKFLRNFYDNYYVYFEARKKSASAIHVDVQFVQQVIFIREFQHISSDTKHCRPALLFASAKSS